MSAERDGSDERDEKKEVVHVYDDDLQELDNKLPRWWLYTLYGAMAFAVVYWYGAQQLKAVATPRDVYDEQMVAVRLEELKKGAALSDESIAGLAKDPSMVASGHDVFASTCAPCHRADAGGNIGPNLTDAYWLHGGKPKNIYNCVHDGVPAKGMPTWGPQLGEEKVASVVAYVLTLRDTNVPNGKPPQGDKEM
jgi:cytochrome c oxidase cbb3-type subunit III